MAYADSAESIERLAAEIGDNVYIDVAKWHLYLRDAKLHTSLAETLYPIVVAGDISEQAVTEVLEAVSIKLGGGRRTVPLSDLVPVPCQLQLIDLLEEFQSQL